MTLTNNNVTNNSPSRDYSHPDDQTTQTTETPGLKPFTPVYHKSQELGVHYYSQYRSPLIGLFEAPLFDSDSVKSPFRCLHYFYRTKTTQTDRSIFYCFTKTTPTPSFFNETFIHFHDAPVAEFPICILLNQNCQIRGTKRNPVFLFVYWIQVISTKTHRQTTVKNAVLSSCTDTQEPIQKTKQYATHNQ